VERILERRLGLILPYDTTAKGSDKLAKIGVRCQVVAELENVLRKGL
jgi:hypothetical protein